MKILLSRVQWEQIGRTAGWLKVGGIDPWDPARTELDNARMEDVLSFVSDYFDTTTGQDAELMECRSASEVAEVLRMGYGEFASSYWEWLHG